MLLLIGLLIMLCLPHLVSKFSVMKENRAPRQLVFEQGQAQRSLDAESEVPVMTEKTHAFNLVEDGGLSWRRSNRKRMESTRLKGFVNP